MANAVAIAHTGPVCGVLGRSCVRCLYPKWGRSTEAVLGGPGGVWRSKLGGDLAQVLFPQLIGLNRTWKNQQGILGFEVTLSITNTPLPKMLTYLK